MKSPQTNRYLAGLFLVVLFPLLLLALASTARGPADAITGAVQPFVSNHTLAGAVMLVASKDKVLALEAVGWSDVAAQKPMETDALFWIASETKAMTAAALMMLVDEGRLKLDDPVEKYLPEFKGQMVVAERDDDHVLLRKPAHPITIREILSHTSGLPFTTPIEQPTLDGLPLRAAVGSYAMTPLQFPPDTKYQYSNAGVNTAGRIIEVISGMPYERFMEERVFQPLGMRDTTFWPDASQLSHLAKAYQPNSNKTGLVETPITQFHYPLSDRASRYAVPAGGLFSTATDTVRFCQMLLNGGVRDGKRLLSEDAVKEMTSRQTAPDLKESYGLGLSVDGDGFGHGGAYSTNMQIDRKHGLIMIWMVQHNGFPGNGGKSLDAFKQAAETTFAP